MEFKMEKADWIFLLLSLLVGVLGEEAFFRDQIGISYFVFIFAFYSLFYWRFRAFSFSHQRVGYLVLIVIWLLAAGYALYETVLFYLLNIVIIPSLVIFHIVLITTPQRIKWSNIFFFFFVAKRLFEGFIYYTRFGGYLAKLFKRSSNPNRYEIGKKVLIGVVISVPFLFIILNLLISADAQFARILNGLPNLLNFRVEYIIRAVIVLIMTFGIFGFMQAQFHKKNQVVRKEEVSSTFSMDGIITLTVLVLLNLVYIAFIAVQFKYFFSGSLEDGFTYAEYARRGFFELLFVTLINLSVTTAVITFSKSVEGFVKKSIKLALTILVLGSGVLLVSAVMRLTMYEDAYGFTFTRVLAHSFMIFLMVIFAYTLVKIWLEKLSLFHFYFIASLIYYAGINMVNLDKFVVERNLERYEATGKIDIHYLNQLSSEGIIGLIELYERNPEEPGLADLLRRQKEDIQYLKSDSWQSVNFTRNRAYEKLKSLQL